MTNHPLGLSGEPFITPPTLSRRDAARLIRRRVSAVGGDGATLFPAETCDEIHRLAGGIPEAMFHLAGEAMRIAAAAKARTVTTAHVREAAGGPTPAVAASAADVPETTMAEATAAGTDSVAMDATDDADADAPEVSDDNELQGAEVAHERPLISAGGIMLPSEPSEDLPQDARAWVSRFLPSPGRADRAPARVARSGQGRGSKPAGSRVNRTPTVHVPTSLDAEASRAGAGASATPPVLRARGLARHSSRPRRSRGRRSSAGGGIVSVAAILMIVAVVVLQVRRGALTSARDAEIAPISEPSEHGAAATESERHSSAPSSEAGSRASADGSSESRDGATPSSGHEPTVSDRVGDRASSSARSTSAHATRPGHGSSKRDAMPAAEVSQETNAATDDAPARHSTPATVPSVRNDPPASRFGLEVATSIFEERARTERQRLAAAGYNVRLVTAQEYGSTVYCVVLGSYPQRDAAERAADTLLSGGIVLQARVVPLPPDR